MAEIDPIVPPTPAADPPVPAAPSAPAGEQAVPYARFKEVNDRFTALKAQVATLTGEKEQQTAAQQTLEQRLAAIESDLTKERHTNQRLKVASEKRLPPELADRLRGDTSDELSADADRLLIFLKPPTGPGVPPPGGGGGDKPKLDTSRMNAAEIRKAYDEGKLPLV